jgi:hypothetical protein
LLRRLRLALGQTDEKHGHLRPGYTPESLAQLCAGSFAPVSTRTYSRFFTEALDTLITAAVGLLRRGEAPLEILVLRFGLGPLHVPGFVQLLKLRESGHRYVEATRDLIAVAAQRLVAAADLLHIGLEQLDRLARQGETETIIRVLDEVVPGAAVRSTPPPDMTSIV